MTVNNENNLSGEATPRLSVERYPAEVRKLGQRAMHIFDSLHQAFVEKGHSDAEAYFYAAQRTPEMYRAELRHSKFRFELA
jgi:hypothetical protein